MSQQPNDAKRVSLGMVLVLMALTTVGGFYFGVVYEQSEGGVKAYLTALHNDLFPADPNSALVDPVAGVSPVFAHPPMGIGAGEVRQPVHREDYRERWSDVLPSGEEIRASMNGEGRLYDTNPRIRAGEEGWGEVGDPKFRSGNMAGYVSSGVARHFGIGGLGVFVQIVHDLAMPHPDLEQHLSIYDTLYPTQEQIDARREYWRERVDFSGHTREARREAARQRWHEVYGEE